MTRWPGAGEASGEAPCEEAPCEEADPPLDPPAGVQAAAQASFGCDVIVGAATSMTGKVGTAGTAAALLFFLKDKLMDSRAEEPRDDIFFLKEEEPLVVKEVEFPDPHESDTSVRAAVSLAWPLALVAPACSTAAALRTPSVGGDTTGPVAVTSADPVADPGGASRGLLDRPRASAERRAVT